MYVCLLRIHDVNEAEKADMIKHVELRGLNAVYAIFVLAVENGLLVRDTATFRTTPTK